MITIFSKSLSSSFQASSPFVITSGEFALDFEIVVGTGPAQVQWYLEFSSSPSGNWYREVAEEDASKGVVSMPAVVRTFADNNATTLPVGTWRFDTEFRRKQQLCRVQMKIAAGAARAKIDVPIGLPVIAAS